MSQAHSSPAGTTAAITTSTNNAATTLTTAATTLTTAATTLTTAATTLTTATYFTAANITTTTAAAANTTNSTAACATTAISTVQLPEQPFRPDLQHHVPDQAYQPSNFSFPRREFGKNALVKRSFQATWFNRWKWLHYDVAQDAAYCFTCCKALEMGKVRMSACSDESFVVKGFTNWKDATRALIKHESSNFHKSAAAALASRVDVSDMLSKQAAAEKQKNRQYLLKVLSSIRFLARQGLPLRGEGNDTDSNLHQLLVLRGEDHPSIHEFLGRQQLKYTSHDVQNELLSIMAQQILRRIAEQIQSAIFFTIMVDETTDCSNREQVVLVFRWVGEDLAPHEEFIGLHLTSSIAATALVAIIEDVILRMNIKLEHCRGQCYDGASTMSGKKKGVAKIISTKESRAIYTHCYGHALNLAVGDTVKQCQLMKSALDVIAEISKLIKKSPKRDASFQKLKTELAPDVPGFRVLCPTRWTVRAASLQSVLDNFEVLLGVWEEAQCAQLDSEMRARIGGVNAQMQTFDFLFGVSLGNLLLRHTDNLSKALQSRSISAAEGQRLATLTLRVLQSVRDDDKFKLFYSKVLQDQVQFDVQPPSLPRKRKTPRRFETGASVGNFHTTAEDRYRQIYYEALDLVIQAVTDRFDQPGYNVYRNLQELFMKACRGEEYEEQLVAVLDIYHGDLCRQELDSQLPLLKPLCEQVCQELGENFSFHDAVKVLSGLSVTEGPAFSGVLNVVKLLLVLPATNATSVRSFSALRRVKTYLRSTMSQERLNNLLVLHVHKEKVDSLALEKVAQDFVSGREGRLRQFGSCSRWPVLY